MANVTAVCINNGGTFEDYDRFDSEVPYSDVITAGKEYDVIACDGWDVKIVDDQGVTYWYNVDRFTVKVDGQPWREDYAFTM